MDKEQQIHHQLSNLEEKEDNYFYKCNILNTKSNFKEQNQLSQWRTSSYPSIPKQTSTFKKYHKDKIKNKSLLPQNQAVINHHELSHRYTFLNQHSSNEKLQKKRLLKKQPFVLSLALPKKQELPSIFSQYYKNTQTNRQSIYLKMYSPKHSGTPYQFFKNTDNIKSKNEKFQTENSNKICWNLKDIEEAEIKRMKGQKTQKVRKIKAKSNNDGNNRRLNRDTINQLRKCLILGKKESHMREY